MTNSVLMVMGYPDKLNKQRLGISRTLSAGANGNKNQKKQKQ